MNDFISIDDESSSFQPHSAADVEKFLELTFPIFCESAISNNLAGEAFNRLFFIEFVIDALIWHQVKRRQHWQLNKSSTIDRFDSVVVCKVFKLNTDYVFVGLT